MFFFEFWGNPKAIFWDFLLTLPKKRDLLKCLKITGALLFSEFLPTILVWRLVRPWIFVV